MQHRNIIDLPVELLDKIMRDVETPKDLYSLIRSASWFNQVFATNKHRVLESVVRNAMGEELLIDAVTACKATQIGRDGWVREKTSSFSRRQQSFLTDYTDRRITGKIDRLDSKLLCPLSRLWYILEDSSLRFCNQASLRAARDLPFPCSNLDIAPSPTEKARIYRGLLRFEIYRKAFSYTIETRTEFSGDRSRSRWESGRLRGGKLLEGREAECPLNFLLQFTDWEQEEILSVYEYLMKFMENMYCELQDYVVDKMSPIVSALPSDGKERTPQEKADHFEEVIYSTGIDVWHPFRSETHIDCLVMRGLPFIRWLSKLPLNDQMSVMRRHEHWDCWPTIAGLLRSNQDWWLREVWTLPPSPPGHGRSICNEGWKWVADSMGSQSRIEDRVGLRQLGYAFWDTTRMFSGWRLGLTAPARLVHLMPSHDDLYDWNKMRPAVRFKDVPLPRLIYDDDDCCDKLDKAFRVSDDLDAAMYLEECLLGEDDGGLPLPFSENEATHFGFEYC